MKHEEDIKTPVVAILGHVDHGKTSLLDAIAKTNVAIREHGGITQGIGAFTVVSNSHSITFIDTPGHEAFAKMRSRGASAADIAVLVVAADDGVMPQTKESIAHIKQAKIPLAVAVTKIDLPGANIEKVKQQLVKEGLTLEGAGGDIPVVPVSSKTGKGLANLLEMIILLSQMANINSSKTAEFEGVIIESKLDRKKGALATVIVKNGTLHVGEEIVAEEVLGKVRALLNDRGENVKEASCGQPAEILGFASVPPVGAKVMGKGKSPQLSHLPQVKTQQSAEGRRLGIILKAENQGVLEAISESLPQDDINIIFSSTGDPTQADILLAKSTSAIVVGFNSAVSQSVSKLAETEGVLVKTYRLIYELIKELKEAAELFQEGKAPEIVSGKAKILAIFPFDKKKVAGCKVLEGRLSKGDKVKVLRGEDILGEARIVSIRKGKEEVNKAETAAECGILLSAQLDFEPADMILSVR
ncbi:translation initiation factor IF-2 [Candidatus Microgenomates bacterium]|nr:translation initiation factor IF-2 [Candidatus Microgenomates bacterium]